MIRPKIFYQLVKDYYIQFCFFEPLGENFLFPYGVIMYIGNSMVITRIDINDILSLYNCTISCSLILKRIRCIGAKINDYFLSIVLIAFHSV